MRTSMNLPDGLLDRLGERAAALGRTRTSLVEEAVRAYLEQDRSVAPPAPLPAWGEPGGGFLVDLADPDAVAAALGDDA